MSFVLSSENELSVFLEGNRLFNLLSIKKCEMINLLMNLEKLKKIP